MRTALAPEYGDRRSGRSLAVALLCCSGVCSGAWAAPPPAVESALLLEQASPQPSWAAHASADLRSAKLAQGPQFSIVELPSEGPPGVAPRRRHRALSVHSDMPQQWLRSIGVEASDCSTRFRLPTKLRRDESGTSVDFGASVGLACSF